MGTDTGNIDQWETQRREALRGLVDMLEVTDVDLDHDPLRLLAPLDGFVATLNYSELDQDDWVRLHTLLAAYLAQVLIVRYHAHWRATTDQRGVNHVLVMTGRDGREHTVSPMDVVYDDLQQLPPAVVRMLATAERTAHLVPDIDD
jgi:hypothetical protein